MDMYTNVKQKLHDITELCDTVYVYKLQCNKIKEIFINIGNIINSKPQLSTNTDELISILDQLNILHDIIDSFTTEQWINTILLTPIKQPISNLKSIMSSINETLEELNIFLKNKYDDDQESFIADIKDIKNKLLNISQNQDSRKTKLAEIEDYLQQIKELNISKEKNSNHDKSSNDDQNFEIDRSIIKKKNKIIESNDMYKIYKGKILSTGEKVKIMEYNDDDSAKEHFERLFEVLSKIQHPNLESFIGAVTSPPYIIVTRLKGRNLYKILDKLKTEKLRKKSGFKIDESINNYCKTIIAFNIAKAMAYVHSLNIIHRDLCSENIYVDEESNPFISNFANSRFIPEESFLLTIKMKRSSFFRAPEFTEKKYNESVDVFSFGGILYNLLTNSPPFHKEKKDDEIEKKINEGKRPLLPINISNDLKNLIEICWSQDSKKRPSFSDIIDLMLEKRITFPDDNIEIVSNFYNDRKITNYCLENCIKSMKITAEIASKSFVYKKESNKVRLLILGYKSILQTEDFIPSFDILNSNISSQLIEIIENLDQLRSELECTKEKKWLESALSFPPTQITKNICFYMNNIYSIMNDLGFEVGKYELENADLAHDFRKIYEIMDYNSKKLKIKDECNHQKEIISEYLQSFGIEIEATQNEIDKKIKIMLSQFKDKRIERNKIKKGKSIGSNGIITVYKSQIIDTNELVAIKEFNLDCKKDKKLIIYLRREISFLMSLNNEYLVSFIGFNDDENEPLWIITKFAEHGNLSNKRKLSPEQKTKIAFKIAQGMQYMHSKNVIHRNLNPFNILLDENDDPKISDFGYAKIFISLNHSTHAGTQGYKAPEVIKYYNYDYKADVFSFGVILSELCNSKKKSCSINLVSLIKSCTDDNPDNRPDFTEIIHKMLSEKIAFDGANQNDIVQFYEMKAKEISS